jgi:hypothetical protein
MKTIIMSAVIGTLFLLLSFPVSAGSPLTVTIVDTPDKSKTNARVTASTGTVSPDHFKDWTDAEAKRVQHELLQLKAQKKQAERAKAQPVLLDYLGHAIQDAEKRLKLLKTDPRQYYENKTGIRPSTTGVGNSASQRYQANSNRSLRGSPLGVIDPKTRKYYPRNEEDDRGGYINPKTGEIYPAKGDGAIHPKTGEFYPGWFGSLN